MATPPDPKKPPAGPRTASGDRLPAAATPVAGGPAGSDPRVRCGLLRVPGPSDQVLEVVAHVGAGVPSVAIGAESVPALRGPLRTRMDSTLPPGEKPAGVAMYDLDLAITRFHDRAYAVARVGPGVDLTDSTESTATGLAKAAWKLPRPC